MPDQRGEGALARLVAAQDNVEAVPELTELGVNLLICSAISVPVESTLWVSGVEVISGICGPADDIVTEFIAGDTTLARFNAPGNARGHRPASELSTLRRSNSKTSRGGGR